jgi:hypothetical protein
MVAQPNSRLITIMLLVAALASGCGRGDKPLTAPVVGTVTLDGEPLKGAVVTFWPKAKQDNPSAGITDESGEYRLAGAHEGAAPGSYKVTVQYYTKADGTPADTSDGMDIQQLVMQGQAQQALPESYSDPAGTALTADVDAGATNVIDFELKRDGT